MKKLISLLFLMTLCSNVLFAQLNVFSDGVVETENQTVVKSDSSHLTDGLDVVCHNQSIPNWADLIWGYYYQTQPNNPGLLTVQSVDGAYFSVRANGNVGIFNPNPGVALEIGTPGSNQQVKVNGSIVLGSDERIKENIKDITNPFDQLKQMRSVSYTFKGNYSAPLS